MNIDNLIKAREILRKEINPKDSGTKEISLLINANADLGLLINRLNNPSKAKKMDRLVNGK